jgi:hypothetical protein
LYFIIKIIDAQRLPVFMLVSLVFKKNTQGYLVILVSRLCRKLSDLVFLVFKRIRWITQSCSITILKVTAITTTITLKKKFTVTITITITFF